ncbi:hypothetical protein DY000_02016120 [Brassica cretica]|uniref:Uncharacterized protein n=1 Tax=Brassica cretica TaxID=69181 RepID=A0ABQ7D6C3_BRACR|nr:hypothetical protein DY000_02016120 [Brassica cretica]
MESALDAYQDDQIILPEFRPSDRTRQTDCAVYRIDPRTSGKELRLDPRPDDRTEARLSRPTRQARTDDRARINFERTDSDSYRSFSFLVRLGHTACTDGRTDGLSDYFDPIFEFNHQEFSKATILKLSDDLSHIWSSSVREKLHSDQLVFDCLVWLAPNISLLLVGPVHHIRQQIENRLFVGHVSHIRRQSDTGISKAIPHPSCDPTIHQFSHRSSYQNRTG